jgi:HAD superfamily hydrolase (TIGR01549 family)
MNLITRLLSYQCIVFDLDNTLYNEKDYLFAAYIEVDKYLNQKYNIKPKDAFQFLVDRFNRFGRKNLFNKLIKQYNLPEETISDLLVLLRNVKIIQKIELFPEMEELLVLLKKNEKQLYILTNGNVNQQKNKIDQIDWKGVSNICFRFANEIEPKPSPKGINRILSDHNLSNNEIVFIGDSHEDEECATNANVDFVHVGSILNADK